jgi:Transposase DDE domain
MAPVERVGQGRGVRAAPPGGAGPTPSGGPVGLVARERGLGQCARQTRGDHVGANPVDRGKPGSKIHLACEGSGLPLTAVVTAANISDVTMLAAVLDDVPAVLTPAGRRRTRPGKLDADKGYDSAGQPRLAAAAWDHGADRSAWDRVVAAAGAASLAGGAGAVVAELLSAAAGAVGSGLGTVLCVRAAGVCPGLLQAALAASTRDRCLLGPGHPDRLVLQADAAVGGGEGRPRLGDLGPHALLDLGRLGVDQRADRWGDLAQPPGGQLG